MVLGICKPPAPEFYDIFLVGSQFAWNLCIVMAICNAITRVQVILYGLACMVHRIRDLLDRMSIPCQSLGFIDFLLFLL